MSPYAQVLLALCIWREASGEGAAGMEAVAWVIANRVRKGWGDWVKVITAPNQFSSMTVLGDSQTVRWPQGSDATWQAAQQAANEINRHFTEGSWQADPTGEATFYRNVATATSPWFDRAVVEGRLAETVVIGHHHFYKEPAKV